MWLKLHGRWHFEYINLVSANRTKEVWAILNPASQMRILRHREIKSHARGEGGMPLTGSWGRWSLWYTHHLT